MGAELYSTQLYLKNSKQALYNLVFNKYMVDEWMNEPMRWSFSALILEIKGKRMKTKSDYYLETYLVQI